jgi:serralysin
MSVNKQRFCTCLAGPTQSPGVKAALAHYKAAVLKDYKWDPGASISIRFLEGDPALQSRVRDVANTWTTIANLSFDWRADGPTDVRIAFQQGNGSWSYIGTVCRGIAEPDPTINFGWLTPDSSDDEVRRVVLHEFGHMIGLIHEHQNPKHAIQWNRPAVIADLSGPPNNWDEATIENNMFHFYSEDTVIATDVDSASIMMYPIPQSWTLDGFSAGLNSDLTDTDKALIQSVYPQ